jgi:hypothetical protein
VLPTGSKHLEYRAVSTSLVAIIICSYGKKKPGTLESDKVHALGFIFNTLFFTAGCCDGTLTPSGVTSLSCGIGPQHVNPRSTNITKTPHIGT